MSIESAYTPVVYNGDAVTVAFPYTFLVTEDAEIVVTETVISTGVETVKTLTTHYTVTGEGTGSGTVTAVVAPAATVRWTIGRRVTRTQLADYVENDSFPAETHELALDKLTMIAQELDNTITRSLRQPAGDVADIAELPPKVDRASMYLGFDSNGDPIPVAEVEDSVPYSAGTWTPGLEFGGGTTGLTYSIQTGRYTKVGRLVTVEFLINLTAKGSSTGNTKLTGLPFTVNAAVAAQGVINWGNMGASFVSMLVQTIPDTTKAFVYGITAGNAAQQIAQETGFGNTSAINGTITYSV